MSVTLKPGAGGPVSRAGTVVLKKAGSKAMLALAPYLIPVLIVVLIIAAGVTIVAVAASAAGAQYSGADAKAQQAAVAAGLPEDQLGSVRAVANSVGIPWQILAALHTVGASTVATVGTPVGSTLSGVTPDDTKRYAQQLLDSPNVTIQQAATRTGLEDTAAGRPVANSCNEQMILSPLLLGALAALTADKWKITIDDFGFPGDRGYCETGTYQHPKGNAVDLQGLVNLQAGQATSPGLDGYPGDDPVIVSAFATDFLAALPAQADGTRVHGGVGQKQCGVNPTFPANSQNAYTFDDSCDHLHVDVRNRTDLMESAITGYPGLSGGTASTTATATGNAAPSGAASTTTATRSAASTAGSAGTQLASTGRTLTLDAGSELVQARFGSDTPRPSQVDQFLGGLLADDMAAGYGAGRMGTLTDGAIRSTDGNTLLTFPADLAEQVANQKQAWVSAIARLPIQGNSDTTAAAVYDAALRLALVPLRECSTTPGVSGIVGGGLSAQAVPEPMRSQMILAGQEYGVPPAVIAALYLTENNGFSFADAYYNRGHDPSAFQLTTSSTEWKLATYGATGLWPAGGTFRGPFQFGPIWESTYSTPEHPNVLLFADAAFGAAHYMADLGAKDNPSDDAINKAAQSYNGQISWSPGGSTIHNPDPSRFSVVKELYAFQVVELARTLSDGSVGGNLGATITAATSTTSTAASPAPTSPAPTPKPTAVTASAAAQPSTGCAAGGAAARGVQVSANGPRITLPDSPDVAEAARGKTITAPTDGMSNGLVAGLKALGTPYVWGGGGSAGPDDGCARAGGELNSCRGLVGFDCSGLTSYVLGRAGFMGIPGNSGSQRAGGTSIPWDQGLPGDIIGYPGHVAVYLGEIGGARYMLEAPEVGSNVRVAAVRGGADDMLHRYWK